MARKTWRSGIRARQRTGADGEIGELLNEPTSTLLFDHEVSTPILDEFKRPLVGLAHGDSSLNVFLRVHFCATSDLGGFRWYHA